MLYVCLNKLSCKIVEKNIDIVINDVTVHWNTACDVPSLAKALSSAVGAKIHHNLYRLQLLCLCLVRISQEDRSAPLSPYTLTRSVRRLAKLTVTVASAGRWFVGFCEMLDTDIRGAIGKSKTARVSGSSVESHHQKCDGTRHNLDTTVITDISGYLVLSLSLFTIKNCGN